MIVLDTNVVSELMRASPAAAVTSPTTSSTAPGPGVTLDVGGDPAVTHVARADTWQRMVAFLAEELR